MNWFEIATIAVVIIGCILYVYGFTKEPPPTKEDTEKPFSYTECFKDVFTDPAKKTRKFGTILIYVGSILAIVNVLLK